MSKPEDDVRALARKLVMLEVRLSHLHKTRDAMQSVCLLVERALHYEFAARGDETNLEAVYCAGFDALSYLSDKSASEVIDVGRVFIEEVKGDAVVGAALDDMHEKMPMGQVWTNESYPEPE